MHTSTSISDSQTLLAQIDWDTAITALHDGHLPVSGGERRILQLAASFPASLRDTIPAWTTRTCTW